ncbi:hypothetical protein SAMN04488522_104391 [Pedobacter caeni]|uniref:Uncharacterized protein n=1 Tax=Pedobacter caeni TaxID=288992 RepID=A0A1M5GVS3_9SPHI|nr:hypothetical protein SAMN04488522_104391 [Pedobacter caeni]
MKKHILTFLVCITALASCKKNNKPEEQTPSLNVTTYILDNKAQSAIEPWNEAKP